MLGVISRSFGCDLATYMFEQSRILCLEFRQKAAGRGKQIMIELFVESVSVNSYWCTRSCCIIGFEGRLGRREEYSI